MRILELTIADLPRLLFCPGPGLPTHFIKTCEALGKHTSLCIHVNIHRLLQCSQHSFFDDLEKYHIFISTRKSKLSISLKWIKEQHMNDPMWYWLYLSFSIVFDGFDWVFIAMFHAIYNNQTVVKYKKLSAKLMQHRFVFISSLMSS